MNRCDHTELGPGTGQVRDTHVGRSCLDLCRIPRVTRKSVRSPAPLIVRHPSTTPYSTASKGTPAPTSLLMTRDAPSEPVGEMSVISLGTRGKGTIGMCAKLSCAQGGAPLGVSATNPISPLPHHVVRPISGDARASASVSGGKLGTEDAGDGRSPRSRRMMLIGRAFVQLLKAPVHGDSGSPGWPRKGPSGGLPGRIQLRLSCAVNRPRISASAGPNRYGAPRWIRLRVSQASSAPSGLARRRALTHNEA